MGLSVTQPHPPDADKRTRLKRLVSKGGFFTVPGVFDLISARIADAHRPAALYMTGYGAVASHLGLPDAGDHPAPAAHGSATKWPKHAANAAGQ